MPKITTILGIVVALCVGFLMGGIAVGVLDVLEADTGFSQPTTGPNIRESTSVIDKFTDHENGIVCYRIGNWGFECLPIPPKEG